MLDSDQIPATFLSSLAKCGATLVTFVVGVFFEGYWSSMGLCWRFFLCGGILG